MAKGYKVCKICGNRYEYCRTKRPTGLFRWQDVACCPEHGAEYFARIAASRGIVAETVIPEDEESDALFEEEFDDSEEEQDIN